MSAMKDCPPKPGSTVITSTISTSSRYWNTASAGVLGLTLIEGRQPSSLIFFMVSKGSDSDSTWNVIMSAPAFAKSSAYLRGSEIIRCTSAIKSVFFFSDLSTGAPIVIFGTKCPSMTSTCIHSAPASLRRFTSLPISEKSQERSDGEIIIIYFLLCM